jgi:hypothetical protein
MALAEDEQFMKQKTRGGSSAKLVERRERL